MTPGRAQGSEEEAPGSRPVELVRSFLGGTSCSLLRPLLAAVARPWGFEKASCTRPAPCPFPSVPLVVCACQVGLRTREWTWEWGCGLMCGDYWDARV